jgi:hypothetical protein
LAAIRSFPERRGTVRDARASTIRVRLLGRGVATAWRIPMTLASAKKSSRPLEMNRCVAVLGDLSCAAGNRLLIVPSSRLSSEVATIRLREAGGFSGRIGVPPAITRARHKGCTAGDDLGGCSDAARGPRHPPSPCTEAAGDTDNDGQPSIDAGDARSQGLAPNLKRAKAPSACPLTACSASL